MVRVGLDMTDDDTKPDRDAAEAYAGKRFHGAGGRDRCIADYLFGRAAERAAIVGHMRTHARQLRNDDGAETVSSILLDEEADAIERGEVTSND